MELNVRALIERALAQERVGYQNADDVLDGISRGTYQLWPGSTSIIVTQLQDHPRCRAVCLFLAAGVLPELQSMLPAVLEWARGEGCTTAFLVGRHGWQRTFLTDEGWHASATVMEKAL